MWVGKKASTYARRASLDVGHKQNHLLLDYGYIFHWNLGKEREI